MPKSELRVNFSPGCQPSISILLWLCALKSFILLNIVLERVNQLTLWWSDLYYSDQVHAELTPQLPAPELYSVTRTDYTVEDFRCDRPTPSTVSHYTAVDLSNDLILQSNSKSFGTL